MYEVAQVRKRVSIRFLQTIEMVADVLMKPLSGLMLYKFSDALMGRTNGGDEQLGCPCCKRRSILEGIDQNLDK